MPLGARLAIAGRVLLAVCGSYAAAALLAIVLALALPMSAINRAMTGTLVGAAALPFAAILGFRAARTTRAWLELGGLVLLVGLAALAVGWRP